MNNIYATYTRVFRGGLAAPYAGWVPLGYDANCAV